MSWMNICRRRAVVRDAAFDEPLRRRQLDSNHASAFAERVVNCTLMSSDTIIPNRQQQSEFIWMGHSTSTSSMPLTSSLERLIA